MNDMRKISDITELAFNITQMSGALSLLMVEDTYQNEMIEQIQLFDNNIKYEVIEYGQKPKFEILLRQIDGSLLIDLSSIDKPKSFLDVLVQLRDKLNDENRLILLSNSAIYDMIESDFEQLKGYGMEVFTLIPKGDERIKIIQSFEDNYQMSSDEFIIQWRDGKLEDTEEYNRWYVLL